MLALVGVVKRVVCHLSDQLHCPLQHDRVFSHYQDTIDSGKVDETTLTQPFRNYKKTIADSLDTRTRTHARTHAHTQSVGCFFSKLEAQK